MLLEAILVPPTGTLQTQTDQLNSASRDKDPRKPLTFHMMTYTDTHNLALYNLQLKLKNCCYVRMAQTLQDPVTLMLNFSPDHDVSNEPFNNEQ